MPLDVEGDLVTIRPADPQPVLYRLTTWAEYEGLPLAGLEVMQPKLEDLFLELTADDGDGS
jgi:hypothetical protein